MDEIFVSKTSKHRFIKRGELGDTVAARLCGFETPEAARLPRLRTLEFIRRLIDLSESASGENKDGDEDENDDKESEEEEEDENEEDEDEENEEDENEEEEGKEDSKRRKANLLSKKYTRVVKRLCGDEARGVPVSAKELKRSLAGLAKGTQDTTTTTTTPADTPDAQTSSPSGAGPAEGNERDKSEFEAVDARDVVLRVTFYTNHVRSQEFYVLGSQRLVELRDAIDCVMDHLERANEHACNSNNNSNSAAGTATGSVKFFKSASFLIENVFYNDLRDKENADYGRPIAEWSERIRRRLHIGGNSNSNSDSDNCGNDGGAQRVDRGSILGPYRTADMSQTRFADLTIRLGVTYAYLHQADCEHKFVFSEVRAVSGGDAANRLRYPLVTFRTKPISRKCDACGLFPGVLITYDDRHAPRVPAYWCRECYGMFHFGVSGQKAYQYKVLPYIYDVT